MYALMGLLVTSVFVSSTLLGIPSERFTKDPAMITGTHPLTGVISNIGILLWCFSASVTLFVWSMRKAHRDDTLQAQYLLCAGLGTAWLMVDDLFMLHDRVFSKYLGIHEMITYAVYLAASLLFLVWFYPVILRNGYRVFLAAIVFFALSVGLDMLTFVLPFTIPEENFLEDSFKFFGIGTWCYYLVQNSYRFHLADISDGGLHLSRYGIQYPNHAKYSKHRQKEAVCS